MLIVDILSWWYTRGWSYVVRRMNYRLDWVMKTFSVRALLSTLFAPFRQTDVDVSKGVISIRIRSAIDRLLSRVIGLIVRLILLFVAALLLILTLILNIVIIILWIFIPLLPIIGLILTAINFKFDLNWLFHWHPHLNLHGPHIKPPGSLRL